jgi:Domain of unknown function (DUF4390)
VVVADVKRLAAALVCSLTLGGSLTAQDRPRLEVSLSDSTPMPEARVSVRALLSDERFLRALESGFPLYLEYHVELRQSRALFDRRVSEWSINYVVLYDPVRDLYVVEDPNGSTTLTSVAALRRRLATVYVFDARPDASGRFHYRARLNARTLSDEDVDEVFAWLKGEYHDSVPVERPGFLARTARSLLIKVAPLPQMELEARTPDFRYP